VNEDTILRLAAVWVDVPPDLERRVLRALAREPRNPRQDERPHRTDQEKLS
jgi:hypothetical protein